MLTLRETVEVIEHGITVGGKSVKDHLEAVDHYASLLWMRELAGTTTPITESTIRDLHGRIVARSERASPAFTARTAAASPARRRFSPIQRKFRN